MFDSGNQTDLTFSTQPLISVSEIDTVCKMKSSEFKTTNSQIQEFTDVTVTHKRHMVNGLSVPTSKVQSKSDVWTHLPPKIECISPTSGKYSPSL